MAADMRKDVNRQLWGGFKISPKYPWVVKKAIAAYHRAHKLRGKHQGQWFHAAGYEDSYEDCECCGQPVKEPGRAEYWYRNCIICNHYEQRDTNPNSAEMKGLEAIVGKTYHIPVHSDHVHVSTEKKDGKIDE